MAAENIAIGRDAVQSAADSIVEQGVNMETDEAAIAPERTGDHDETVFDEVNASGTILDPAVETADLPISGLLETFMVGNLQESLADGPADQTPASPPVMMPIISAPE